MKNKTKLVIANWKMNPEREEDAKKIASETAKGIKGIKSVKLVICPPFVFLNAVSKIVSGSKNTMLGAQDVFLGEGASHTGETSVEMLKSVGAKYIIVGHSEKRESGDTDEVVRNKLFGVLKSGLNAILCVGEKERNEHGYHFAEIEKQIKNATEKLPKKFAKKLIVAYEPVWAIGKSEKEAMKPEELHETVIFIKKVLSDILKIKEPEKIFVLYGGSVTKGNAKKIVEEGKVNGLLVGRESLKTEDFTELVREIAY
jgi:triosephosphate isomerase